MRRMLRQSPGRSGTWDHDHDSHDISDRESPARGLEPLDNAASTSNRRKHAQPPDLLVHKCRACEFEVPLDTILPNSHQEGVGKWGAWGHTCHDGPPLRRMRTDLDAYVSTQVPVSLQSVMLLMLLLVSSISRLTRFQCQSLSSLRKSDAGHPFNSPRMVHLLRKYVNRKLSTMQYTQQFFQTIHHEEVGQNLKAMQLDHGVLEVSARESEVRTTKV